MLALSLSKTYAFLLTTLAVTTQLATQMAQITQEASTSAAPTTPPQEEFNLDSLWEESKHYLNAFHP